ncbi:MAG TPA: DJ-1/PfpI family protein [Solirubrobacterales bacterium]|nr:DJ-1/PfpI family protein [Solirubrobacterales bacterium]
MRIAILIFDRLTALDAVGPYEVLSRIPGSELTFVAAEAGPKRTDTDRLALVAEATIDELPEPDVLLVPGGEGNRPLMRDERMLDWLRGADRASTWTTSVCTGSLLLGAAGLLEGRRATSHWAYRDRLAGFGATAVDERVVTDGKLITAAGVSAGIDMALTLAARIASDEVAQAIQLGIEYDPAPPFDAGSPERAPGELVELVRSLETGSGE